MKEYIVRYVNEDGEHEHSITEDQLTIWKSNMEFGTTIIFTKEVPWFKDGICNNDGTYNCNLGYACDACPHRKDKEVIA